MTTLRERMKEIVNQGSGDYYETHELVMELVSEIEFQQKQIDEMQEKIFFLEGKIQR
jgi:uncharacterized coiled-coil DUF342 family protein